MPASHKMIIIYRTQGYYNFQLHYLFQSLKNYKMFLLMTLIPVDCNAKQKERHAAFKKSLKLKVG